MIYSLLADIVFWLHLFFVGFVLFGGILVLRWRRLIWIHIPVAVWGIVVEWGNFICPLTPLENYLRGLGGRAAYDISFTEEYLYPLIYIQNLDSELQFILGLLVVMINSIIYGLIFIRSKRRKQ